jgi:hypothetical protein
MLARRSSGGYGVEELLGCIGRSFVEPGKVLQEVLHDHALAREQPDSSPGPEVGWHLRDRTR